MPDFKKHKELLYCGKCPFLEQPWGKVLGNEENPIRTKDQENNCKVSEYYFGKENEWEVLSDGINPKRKKGCLQLAKHIHEQMANAFPKT